MIFNEYGYQTMPLSCNALQPLELMGGNKTK